MVLGKSVTVILHYVDDNCKGVAMGRHKALDDTQVKWAHLQWVRGCKLEDIAATLDVSRWTLQREFRERGYKRPSPLPDEEWILPHNVAK